MNQPYVLQRFELKGKYPLIIEGDKFIMEKCSAIGYLAFVSGVDSRELVRRMEDALNQQYGKQMEIRVAEQKKIEADSDIPEALINELNQYIDLPFFMKYIPTVEDEKLYGYFDGRLIPTLSMTLFVPENHKKYFDTRSVCLDYKKIKSVEEWSAIEREIEDFRKIGILFEDWLPRNRK